MQYLWEQLHLLEPHTELGGIYADKPGYHNTRAGNDPHNYSVVDAEDQGGPSNLAAALDWTFPDAQAGRYDLIIKYSKRLLDSGEDVNDSRLDWMREFYGQADEDTKVEGWDYRYGEPSTSDPSHLWHIHFSFSRNALTKANMDLLLAVLRGDDMALSDEDVQKVAKATLDMFLKKEMTIPDDWKALWPNDPGIQDGKIGLDTLWRSGYFHGRQANEELTGGPDALEVPSKLEQILAKDETVVVGAELLKQVMLDPTVVETYSKAIGDQIVGLRYERTDTD